MSATGPEALGRLAVLINIALIILLAYNLAGFSWRWLLPTALPPSTVTPPQALTPAPKGVDYSAIANWHLFGQPSKAAAAAPAQKAPQTPLNLKLLGTLASDSQDKARALIAEGNSEERLYRIGEALPGGARLDQVLRNRVVLYRNGRQESLSLPKDTGASSTTHQPSLSVPAAEEPSDTAAPEPRPPDAVTSSPQTVDASAIAARLRNEVATRPEALQDLAFANPHVESGQFVGFRLRPGRDRRLLQQLGLRQGDIITEVNGTPLTDPTQGLTVLQQLLSAPQVSIQITRDGVQIPLTFVLTQAATE